MKKLATVIAISAGLSISMTGTAYAADPAAQPGTPGSQDTSKRVCKSVTPTGSRFSQRVCKTPAQWQLEAEKAQKMLEDGGAGMRCFRGSGARRNF